MYITKNLHIDDFLFQLTNNEKNELVTICDWFRKMIFKQIKMIKPKILRVFLHKPNSNYDNIAL